MATLLECWKSRCIQALISEPEAYIQIRKMFINTGMEVPWESFIEGNLPSFHSMGYSKTDAKMNQLKRNYFNEEALETLRETFLSRLSSRGNKASQTCVSAYMGNRAKDKRSKGFCMQTLTLNYLKRKDSYVLQLELHYRTTELTQKFLADLVFLREEVFPFIMQGWPKDLTPTVVKFNFSSCYISTMFLPILFQHAKPFETLKLLKQADKKYYRTVSSAFKKWLVEDCNYSYQSRAKMHSLFRERVYPKMGNQQINNIKKLIGEKK